jgi:AGZA family xanthine/uracil permease-like MFS transporter
MLRLFFELDARKSTVARELRGAMATFLTMAYILFANPGILQAAGIPVESAMAATALTAGLCSIAMGLFANIPLALAPGMGLNAFVAYQLTSQTGSWQAAMGLVVVEGLAVFLLVAAGLRETAMHAIPSDLRRAMGAGIGLFIAFIGAVNARLVVVPASTLAGLQRDPSAMLPPVGPGTLSHPDTLLAVCGLALIGVLLARHTPGALLYGIVGVTLAALALDRAQLPDGAWLAVPRLDTFGQADVTAAFSLAAVPLVLSLMMVDFFDTLGTATAIAEEAQLTEEDGRVPRLRRLLAIDALSASVGGLFGASSATAYVESAAGVAEGARTGLHSVAVGVLFVLAAFCAPIAAVVPPAATGPALMAVGFIMMLTITRIDFRQPDTALPAFVTILMVPLTYSIAHGIGYGLLTYVVIAVLRGRARELSPMLYVIAAAFALYFWNH